MSGVKTDKVKRADIRSQRTKITIRTFAVL